MKQLKSITVLLSAGILSAFILLLSCSKSTSTPTPASTTSTNTGCGDGILCADVNGTVPGNIHFIADAYPGKLSNTPYKSGSYCQLIRNSGSFVQFVIEGENASSQELFNLAIFTTSSLKTGVAYTSTTPMSTGTPSLNFHKFDPTPLVDYVWSTNYSTGHTGTITLTKYDTAANLASGTFNFTGDETSVNTTGDHSTITVTNGSFTNLIIQRF